MRHGARPVGGNSAQAPENPRRRVCRRIKRCPAQCGHRKSRQDKAMARDVHLVGSVPMANAREVFEKVSAALGPRIKRLPDGETGERGDWISWLEPAFSQHPAFEK